MFLAHNQSQIQEYSSFASGCIMSVQQNNPVMKRTSSNFLSIASFFIKSLPISTFTHFIKMYNTKQMLLNEHILTDTCMTQSQILLRAVPLCDLPQMNVTPNEYCMHRKNSSQIKSKLQTWETKVNECQKKRLLETFISLVCKNYDILINNMMTSQSLPSFLPQKIIFCFPNTQHLHSLRFPLNSQNFV